MQSRNHDGQEITADDRKKVNKPTFSICTPTFNRAHTLPRLYTSLQDQTIYDFEWIIIDDGSTDQTNDIVREWLREERFSVRYFYVENGGKPRAVNYAVKEAAGAFFIIVDSDDYLLSDAIEKFLKWVREIENENSIAGVGAARGYSCTRYIKGSEPFVNESGYVDATNLQRKQYNLDADMVEAYRTDLYRQFPFAEWPGEKFAPEQISLNEMALQGYKVRWHKDIVYICEYMPDGLTRNSQRLLKDNPMGYAMMYNHMLKYQIPLKQKMKVACQMIALSFYGGNPGYLRQSNAKTLTLLVLPFGALLSFRRRRQLSSI